MPFIPHTEADVKDMLDAIGAGDIETLFDEIPSSLRMGKLSGVPDGMNEQEITRLMMERAEQDGRPLCFMGAGAYDHHVPAAVWEITTRGEFYSAYTPYQAEASQGTLQLIYEYQTMMAGLTGLDVSNADGNPWQPQVEVRPRPGADHRTSALPQDHAYHCEKPGH